MKSMFVLLVLSLPVSSFCDPFLGQLFSNVKNEKEIPSPSFENDDPSSEKLKVFWEYMDSLNKFFPQFSSKII